MSNCSDPGEYLIKSCCSARRSVNSLSALAGTTIFSLYLSRSLLKFLSAPETSILFATIRVGFEIFLSSFASFFVSVVSKLSNSFSSRFSSFNASIT